MSNDDTLGDFGDVEGMGFGSVAEDMGDGGAKKFYGKYRGTVINNVDPKKEGRLWVQVPDVLGYFVSSWAEPCVPFAGIESGMYVVPPPKAGVWVEFEQGNPEKPIWVGCFWGTVAEVPKITLPAVPGLPIFAVQTPLQNAIVVADSPIPPNPTPGVMMKSGLSYISVGPDGITMSAPKITILGPITTVGPVNLNAGGLQVI